MENSSTKSILETINESIGSNNAPTSPVISSTSSENSWLDYLSSISITTWIIIILILAFLGFNIFSYLAKGTEGITNFFGPIIAQFTSLIAIITGQVINTTATGAKGVVDTTAEVLDTGLTNVQRATTQTTDYIQGKIANSSTAGTTITNAIPHADIMQNNTLNKALNQTNAQKNIGVNDDYIADDSTSSIQKNQSKSGYCYIGEDKGIRTCMRVNENDGCISGDIFPSREICINPSLRV
jgi:hypothetical protein